MANENEIERYGIYWVVLDPTLGAEIRKTCPMVVISDDLRNRYLSTVVGCPLTSTLHPQWRSRLQMICDGHPAEIAVDQIRTLSKQRFRAKIDHLTPELSAQLRRLIVEMYGS